jgi:hypothetical protein
LPNAMDLRVEQTNIGFVISHISSHIPYDMFKVLLVIIFSCFRFVAIVFVCCHVCFHELSAFVGCSMLQLVSDPLNIRRL